MSTTTLVATLIATALTVLGAIVTVVMFAGRLSVSLEHLASAVANLAEKLDAHETRISHVEGRLGRRASDG